MSLVNEQSDTMSDMGKIVLAVRYERTDALLRVLIQAADIEGRIMIGLPTDKFTGSIVVQNHGIHIMMRGNVAVTRIACACVQP